MPFLVLNDGTSFEGESFGAWPQNESNKVQEGEVVFNTSMTGYQEMVTDLSYAGQILVLTHPQIGNYGWHDEENEADKVLMKGLVVRELSEGEGSEHANRSLEEFCRMHGIWGFKGIDTRALTRHIRNHGTVPGVLVNSLEQGIAYWKNKNELESLNTPQEDQVEQRSHWVYKTTVQESYEIPGNGPYVAVLDFGAKRNILRSLQQLGFRIRVFPAWSSAEEILASSPRGLLLSNGPGDPSQLPEIVSTVRSLLPKLPIMGICLGHQILALAAGGKTYKLPFGHRGGNHPVQDIRTGKTTMTAQNHGYAVEEGSLDPSGFEVILRNLNDGTVEGMEHTQFPVFSIQYHPEGAPGPEENMELFERFVEFVGMNR
jgi:carbamoyl-phosphate synthase small subunit